MIFTPITDQTPQADTCHNADNGRTCVDMFDCCDCGGNDCGCRYCWSCRACPVCKDSD